MRKIAFFDTKPYDRIWFDRINTNYEMIYYENKLNHQTAQLAQGCDAAIGFVNDEINAHTIEKLYENDVKVLALRCAGYNHVDVKAAYEKISIVRVPDYSPYAVAEHAMALFLSLNRKIHKAYNRTRDFNFSLNGLIGTDLFGKTAGIIGTGKIGRIFINICKGFGMHVIAYDPFPAQNTEIRYVDLDTLYRESDLISLHCPLTEQTKHIINRETLKKMKNTVSIINTSRGGLIESEALLDALTDARIKGAALDVYEEESNLFFEDYSNTIIHDNVLSLLVSKPNVIITSHQAFLTDEALCNIANTTLANLDEYFAGGPLTNEICYQCKKGETAENCLKSRQKRCF